MLLTLSAADPNQCTDDGVQPTHLNVCKLRRSLSPITVAGVSPLMLASMTLVINLFMHDFWNVYEGLSQAHETQNFVKNLAIMAGLLALAAGPGTRALSLDGRKNNQAAANC